MHTEHEADHLRCNRGAARPGFDAFYKINEELAKKVLSIYDDSSMNEKKAKKWIKENCKPNETVQKISDFSVEKSKKSRILYDKIEISLFFDGKIPDLPQKSNERA